MPTIAKSKRGKPVPTEAEVQAETEAAVRAEMIEILGYMVKMVDVVRKYVPADEVARYRLDASTFRPTWVAASVTS